MIGHSLRNDIAGAHNAGIWSIRIDRTGQQPTDGVEPGHEVTDLTEVLNLL